MPDSELSVHAGLPRTGTTTLQTHLFAAHSQIDYLGIFKGAIATPETGRNSLCRDSTIAELMRELLFDNPLAPDVPRCRALWQDICNRSRPGRMVWSWEGLATDVPRIREARACNLARIMRPARVFVTLRSPSSLLESSYFQILRRNNWGCRRPVWYRPIDEWLASQWNTEIAPILDYERTVEIYARLFGEDAIHVLLFEELQRDPSSFVASICRRLAIDDKEGVRRTRYSISPGFLKLSFLSESHSHERGLENEWLRDAKTLHADLADYNRLFISSDEAAALGFAARFVAWLDHEQFVGEQWQWPSAEYQNRYLTVSIAECTDEERAVLGDFAQGSD